MKHLTCKNIMLIKNLCYIALMNYALQNVLQAAGKSS